MVRIRSGAPETFPERVRQAFLQTPEGIPASVERVLVSIEALTTQLREADKEMRKIAKESETCGRLMTLPGVGPVTAVRFSAALDTVKRFRNAHSVGSYLGLTPGEDSSSTRERRLSITKAGPPHVRWTLTQACWSAVRTRPNDPMVVWAKEVEKRRGKRIAIIALARKMAGILFALWRDGSTYKPNYETEKSKKTERSGVGK